MKSETSPPVAVAPRKDESTSARTGVPSLHLEPLAPAEIARWDELVLGFPQHTVFHRRAWLESVAEGRGVEWRFWAVTQGSRVVGYFCGGIVRRGPFRMLGSPLRSWHTNYQGPLLHEEVCKEDFAAALDELVRAERFDIVEIEYAGMPHAAFENAGFSCYQNWTELVDLSRDRRQMMLRMSNGRKHGVRKSTRHGLELVECEDVGTRLYDQLQRALGAKGAECPFGPEFPQAIVRHLRPAGLLYSLGVRDPEGKIIATGIFPCDNGTVYQWESASEIAGREWHPNDLLHWGLMCRAAADGLRTYDMSGYGRFNRAFGSRMVETYRWYKCYSAAAKLARAASERFLSSEHRHGLFGRLMRKILR